MLLPDKFREECGVVAIYAHPEAEKLAYLGLHALQHRGQESAGMVTSDGLSLHPPGNGARRRHLH
jgi:amidophosphoribosyltransferase